MELGRTDGLEHHGAAPHLLSLAPFEGMTAMLARQLETDRNAEVPPDRLKLVGERPIPTREEEPRGAGRFAFFGNAMGWLREQARQQPERYAHLSDRLLVLGIIIVVVVSAYVFIVDPS